MPQFDLSTYEDVKSRIDKFWEQFPVGRLETELISNPDVLDTVVVKASVYKYKDDNVPSSTGLAFEKVGQTFKDGANVTSHLENCFTGDTEILTMNGWITIKDYVESLSTEHVACIESEMLQFAVPQKTIVQEAKDIYTIEDNLTRQSVTGNHRIWLEDSIVTAQVLFNKETDGKRWNRIKDKVRHSFNGFRQGWLSDPSEEFTRILQWIIADGWVDYKANSVKFGFTKDRKVERLVKLLTDIGIKFSRTVNSNGVTNIYCSGMSRFIEYLPKKTLSIDLVLSMSSSQSVAFIEEIRYTDGTDCRGGIYLRTIDREYIENLCLLSVINGYDATSLSFDNVPTGFDNRKPIHRVRLKKDTRRQSRRYTKESFEEPLNVYCLTMECGNFITRGNGKISLSLNCETSAIGRALANMGYQVKKENPRPSQQEMNKVVNKPVAPVADANLLPVSTANIKQMDDLCDKKGHSRIDMKGWTVGRLKKEVAELYKLPDILIKEE